MHIINRRLLTTDNESHTHKIQIKLWNSSYANSVAQRSERFVMLNVTMSECCSLDCITEYICIWYSGRLMFHSINQTIKTIYILPHVINGDYMTKHNVSLNKQYWTAAIQRLATSVHHELLNSCTHRTHDNHHLKTITEQ